MSITMTPASAMVAVSTRQLDYHEQFAAVYDNFYLQRDVKGEVEYAADLLGLTGGDRANKGVLDFGCGTGSHVMEFAKLGLAATGFDISSAMIDQAKRKGENFNGPSIEFATGTFDEYCRGLHGQRFDGAVSFFNVLNCMQSPSLMVENLSLIRQTLAPGAKFLVDLWNGAAVFVDEPRPDVRHYSNPDDPDVEMIRITIPRLDRIAQRCTLQYRVLTLNRRDNRFSEFESTHNLHFLTPTQYRHLFELAGLTIIDEFPKGKAGTPISDRDWYISYLVKNEG